MSDTPKNRHVLTILRPRGDPIHLRRKSSLVMMEGDMICITCKDDRHRKYWITIKPETIDMLYEARQNLKNEGDKWTPPESEPIVGSNIQVGEFDHKEPS